MKNQSGFIGKMIAVYLLLLVAGAIGWVMNIIDVVNSDFSNITGMLVVRVIGIVVPPLGAILGISNMPAIPDVTADFAEAIELLSKFNTQGHTVMWQQAAKQLVAKVRIIPENRCKHGVWKGDHCYACENPSEM